MAAYAAGFRYEQLPPEVVREAKRVILDTLGAMLLASSLRYGSTRLLGDMARRLGGTPECTIIGRDFKTDAVNAALVNGTMGYAGDIEGAGISAQHAGAVLVPAVMVMAERERAGGRALIAALALAYDVTSRVGEALGGSALYKRGYHPSSVLGHFGAAAGAGYLLRLDEAQYALALGLAGHHACGLIRLWLGDATEYSRPFVIGLAASNGIRSALLAQIGFGGPPAIFDEGDFDIYPVFSEEKHPAEIVKDLGSDYRILQHHGFKRYACCAGIHTGLDALFNILSRHPLQAEEIAEIVHWVTPGGMGLATAQAHSHNAPYMLAVGAVNGKIVPDDIVVDRTGDPRVRDLMGRIHLQVDMSLTQGPGRAPAAVEIVTRDRRRFKEEVRFARGARENPMAEAEVEEKFMMLATTVMSKTRAQEIRDLVHGLETLPDANSLPALLVAGGSSA
ncbi:MAG: MmgE/PrpD family protein [Anaerolineae bacterium]|nr:MmgE/PrpD family protein [Anaerolineae bacterium]